MFARLVVVKCQPGKEAAFVQQARGGLHFYQGQAGCREVRLLRSQSDPSQFIALSMWDREVDLLAAREKPEYQRAMTGLSETYAEPQAVGEWDCVEL